MVLIVSFNTYEMHSKQFIFFFLAMEEVELISYCECAHGNWFYCNLIFTLRIKLKNIENMRKRKCVKYLIHEDCIK